MSATPVGSSKLDTGLAEVKRLADAQIEAIHQIQSRVGVLLGFDATVIGAIFALGHAWLSAHIAIAIIAGVLLFTSAIIFGWAMMIAWYVVGPLPEDIVEAVNDPTADNTVLLLGLVRHYARQFNKNEIEITNRFAYVNYAIGIMLMGLAVIALGVLSP